jgi:hypothetical protein
MTELEQAITSALANPEDSKAVNKAYLEFIKANFIIPVEKYPKGEEVEVLFLKDHPHTFLPVFTSMAYFDSWVAPIKDEVSLLKLSGVDLLKGIGEEVTVCMNIDSSIYKEFNSAELARMRSMVIKLFK